MAQFEVKIRTVHIVDLPGIGTPEEAARELRKSMEQMHGDQSTINSMTQVHEEITDVNLVGDSESEPEQMSKEEILKSTKENKVKWIKSRCTGKLGAGIINHINKSVYQEEWLDSVIVNSDLR